MFGVALLTSALFAFSSARIYNRCELAGDLLRLGVDKEQLATWVCIAFHESRFDTAARNPHSGDHGLLQISELYWCGPGKACGVPCSAFRDDDIADDVECAQQIYKEHTRLQGDGFLAWVVYPHHCRYNAKKYLADCDNNAYKPDDRGRSLRTRYQLKEDQRKNESIPFHQKFPNIDDLKPPYIAINAILRGRYDEQIDEKINHVKTYSNDDKNHPFEWLNNRIFEASSGNLPTFKIHNIDELKPPVYNTKTSFHYNEPSTTTTIRTTTIDPALKDIKPPNPRRIETNQFRRRKTFQNFPEKSLEIKDTMSPTSQIPILSDKSNLEVNITIKPSTVRQPYPHPYINQTLIDLAKINNEQQNNTVSILRQDTTRQDTTSPANKTEMSLDKLSSNITTSQNNVWTTTSPIYTPTFRFHTSAFSSPNLKTEYAILDATKASENTRNQSITSTLNPRIIPQTTPFPRSSLPESTPRNELIRARNISSSLSTSNTDTRSSSNRRGFKIGQGVESTTIGPRTTRSWITYTPRSRSFTLQPESPTSKPTIYSPTTTSKTTTTQPIVTSTSKTTSTTKFSIFDLYLRPTKRPNIVVKFPEFKDSPSRLRIFSGGTTALPPFYSQSNTETENTNRKIS